MSYQRNASKIIVPDELRDVLLEFTISYLLEQPVDIIDYAIAFFTQLRESRQTQLIQDPAQTTTSTPDESVDEEPPIIKLATRRKSVFAETYNPEEDEEDDGLKIVHPKTDAQRERLADSIKHILLFRSLDEDQMTDVLDAMFEKIVKSGEIVIRQGDDGDNFYVIERGKFEVYVRDQTDMESLIHTYDNRGAFGELALLYNMPRAATIKAITNGTLWAMDRQTFRRILLKSAYKKRKMYEDLINKVPMLKSLEPYERMNLADALVPKHYSDGDQIIKQGDSADGMYFVEDGIVRITIRGDDGREIEINRVPAGGYLGELALVTHKPRAASAYAVGEVKLAFLDVEAFERLLGPCMELMKRNIEDYEDQIIKIFGSKTNISDIR
ncbi:cAMP-dependent protein kinase type II regulatory subunit isoform X1 [Apis mellifera caucasica]|uniref:cAMP-dependent protein kinase type II regulatory subunit n=2 Tax=Apis mellifera TaxID=7460 RepID=A0A7M7TEX3_APIME|nr:cAMP-dependent protein kinase type II regulatory subunit isoform X1 [Apis mellifera]KAG6796815.1 cAMP-dependent protein kinase type II regulatory subunit isoform X1 [Apis mellifera caucasica]KAG9430579.1 cAMP-dependent protein kinase type II regulatory subunit isoform X1 [Apis mellifera carnica]CAG27571.1 cAMP-dependent protein kinase type II regulatory chain [Apis mellifera carnica]|eukprot:XP_392905.2 cAMP-dependent protein kinase type II regulatory subunit isoform X1 [Apis mellifera]